MNKVVVVMWREFLATVRTRAFLLTVVLMPGLIVGGIFGTKYVQQLTENEKTPLRTLALIDHSGQLGQPTQMQFAAHNEQNPNKPMELTVLPPEETNIDDLAARVRSGELYGYIIIPANVLALENKEPVQFARRDNQLRVGELLERMINNSVYTMRFQEAGVDPTKVDRLRQPVRTAQLDATTGDAASDDRVARFLMPFAFMFLLFMGTFGISQGLLTTVIEEKSSRVVEVLLSAVSPIQLMAGKIIGTALVGFLLMIVWGGAGYYSAESNGLGGVVAFEQLFLAFIYFVPGFLLMASLLAGIGAACNELKEAQSMVFPLSIITIVPMIFWFYISEHPASLFSVVLSYIPPITPFVMILRLVADPETPLWQVVTTQLVLWAAVLAAMWAAGKVFRVGVLMYGKPPSPSELLRWIRQA